jgi:two-component system CheB/CheR fusion protein
MKVQDIDDMGKMINVYVIPYNKEIEVVDGHIKLVPRPENENQISSIDFTLFIITETHKENVIELCYQEMLMMEPKRNKQAGGLILLKTIRLIS